MMMLPQRRRSSLLLFPPVVILAAMLGLGNAFQSPMVVTMPLMAANAGQRVHDVLVAKSLSLSSSSSPFGVTTWLPTETAATAPTIDSWAAVASSTTTTTTTLLAAADAATLDPTTFLTNILSGVLNTPLILAVPIVAALSVAGLMAFLIISYASPEVDED